MKLAFLTLLSLLLFSCASKPTYEYREAPSIDASSMTAAIPVKLDNLQYPKKAARNGVEGWVYFEFELNESGEPRNIKVLDSHPEYIFVREATKSIRKWQFKKFPGIEKYRYLLEFKIAN